MPKYNDIEWDSCNLYLAKAGDTWDWIAFQAYEGNATLSPVILSANQDLVDRVVLEGGEVIRIPIIDLKTAKRLPPWKGGSA